MQKTHPRVSEKLQQWVDGLKVLCKPEAVYWCNGSQEEYDAICAQLVEQGTFIKLNPALRPNSFLARSDPSDVSIKNARKGSF